MDGVYTCTSAMTWCRCHVRIMKSRDMYTSTIVDSITASIDDVGHMSFMRTYVV